MASGRVRRGLPASGRGASKYRHWNRFVTSSTMPQRMGLEESYWSPSLTAPAKLNVEAPGVFQRLRERGLKIGLICNTGRGPGHALRELMRREGVLDYFDATIFSDEVGYGKPDTRIFLTAAERLRLKPSDILHVGDNIENDVRGAQSAGMKTLLFEYEVPS